MLLYSSPFVDAQLHNGQATKFCGIPDCGCRWGEAFFSSLLIFTLILSGCVAIINGQEESDSSGEAINLVVNPGFEDGQAAWVPYSPDLCFVTSSVSFSGSKSLECRNPGPSHKQQGLTQTILLNQEFAQPILISGSFFLIVTLANNLYDI